MIKAATPAAIRIIPTTSSTSTPLSLGFPQIDQVRSGGANTYTFTPRSTAMLSVAITPLIEGDPNVHITGPGTTPREWTSEEIGADSLAITPSAEEVGQAFTVLVPSANQSWYTITVSETSETSPTTLLGGLPLEASASAGTDHFFRLRVPPGLTDVVLVVTALYGDADLFVNTQEQGFYTYDDTEIEPSSTWSSQFTYGADSVVIDSTHPSFLRAGGDYLVTVHAVRDCKFVLRGYSAVTVITLTEGV